VNNNDVESRKYKLIWNLKISINIFFNKCLQRITTAWNVFALPKNEAVSSNNTRGTDVCVYFFYFLPYYFKLTLIFIFILILIQT
jgi:hypothetical protein